MGAFDNSRGGTHERVKIETERERESIESAAAECKLISQRVIRTNYAEWNNRLSLFCNCLRQSRKRPPINIKFSGKKRIAVVDIAKKSGEKRQKRRFPSSYFFLALSLDSEPKAAYEKEAFLSFFRSFFRNILFIVIAALLQKFFHSGAEKKKKSEGKREFENGS